MTARRHCRGRAVARRAAAVSKQRLSQAASNSARRYLSVPAGEQPRTRCAQPPWDAVGQISVPGVRCKAGVWGQRMEFRGIERRAFCFSERVTESDAPS